jgi:DNA-binding response OmpR family regulator
MVKEILIAEADKMVQEEFERIFEATGHHLIFTNNDEEAVLRGRLFKPDLIVGGRDLCQRIRSDKELKEIRFVILLDMFEDLSEKERKRLNADGMISRPLNEDEVLSTVNPFIGGIQERAGDEVHLEDNLDWKSFADMRGSETVKKEEFSLDGAGGVDEEEEIIELVDVVEEPESKMSIDDFALQQKEELIGEITPIESWDKPEREEVVAGKESLPSPKEKEKKLEEFSLQIDEPILEKKVSSEDELFEKIELEDILRRVEKLTPSIEKEWPEEREQKAPEKVPEKVVPPPPKAEERYTGFDEFEAALKGEVKTESLSIEEELQPFFIEETKQTAPKLAPPEEAPVELDLQELTEEEFPEIFLEELTEELEKLEEEELRSEEVTVEVEEETTEEEEISELFGEEIQPSKQALPEVPRTEEPPLVEELLPVEEMAPVEEIAPVEELKELEVAAPEITEMPKVPLKEIPPPAIHLDQKIEEVITKGVEEMMQDFVTKVVPEMAQHMITSTMERIETMVKEVIPDLAEKAIQEEIQRLQKGEKD